jgi:hypothetical protein
MGGTDDLPERNDDQDDDLKAGEEVRHNMPLATSDKRQADIAEKIKVQVVYIP